MIDVRILQDSESFLCIIGFWLRGCYSFTRGKHTETNVCQGAADRPAICNVFLYGNIGVSGFRACGTYALYNFLDCTLIDKIFKPQPIGISKLKFVVVC